MLADHEGRHGGRPFSVVEVEEVAPGIAGGNPPLTNIQPARLVTIVGATALFLVQT